MEYSDSSLLGVDQNDRQAISCLDGKNNAGHAGDEAIPDQWFSRLRFDAVNEIGMNLAEGNEWPRLPVAAGAELVQESRSIAFDFAARILLSKSQIEDVAPVDTRKSAGSRAESVNQPGKADEGFRTKYSKSSLAGTLGWHHNILTIKTSPRANLRAARRFCTYNSHAVK